MSKFAAAYAMKRKKMAKGGEAEDHNGIDREVFQQGVHAPASRKDMGKSGAGVMNDLGMKEGAKASHKRVLETLKGMDKPKLQGMAEGGSLKLDWRQQGIHHQSATSGNGRSISGNDVREGRIEEAKRTHEHKLQQLKNMPKPKLKGLAEGGYIEEENMSGYKDHEGDDVKHNGMAMSEDDRKLGQHGEEEVGPEDGGEGFHGEEYMGRHDDPHDEYQDPHAEAADDLVSRVMKQRMYSKGGMVANGGEDDLKELADGKPNNFDDLSLDDDLEASDTDKNSGDEHGNKRMDEDERDIVSRVMKSWMKKGRMPSPK